LDNLAELTAFAKRLEAATLRTIEEGRMTGDLAKLADPAPDRALDSWEFIDEIAKRV
jgi:isocitrate dehydrogenase